MSDFVPEKLAGIFADIANQRAAQDQKWGNQDVRSLETHMTIIVEEVGEVANEVNDLREKVELYGSKVPPEELATRYHNMKVELIQVATCAVQMIEAVKTREVSL